jgi:hypothetical protein
MVTPEIIEYVRQQLNAGQDEQAVRNALSATGWIQEDTDAALRLARETQSTPNAVNAVSPVQTDTIAMGVLGPVQNVNMVVPGVVKRSGGVPRLFDFKSLRWYEWMAMVPVLFLLARGGAIGAGVAILGWRASLYVTRNDSLSVPVKTFCVIGITLGYCFFYFAIAVAFVLLTRGLTK